MPIQPQQPHQPHRKAQPTSLQQAAALENSARLQQSQEDLLKWLIDSEQKPANDGYLFRKIR